ncbi:hypothetical protein K488DRAFT_91749 [Vararia minispora EC-137]|uniref:Uncharacterized protein n=1 Tax=Vararia minispora EC-137 TaxID=1314806 RepID=A0ACB8Q5J2_9AGAM|nr:hypothetical protein K488DRAFT_91749 [Vararia minispora EC-137]
MFAPSSDEDELSSRNTPEVSHSITPSPASTISLPTPPDVVPGYSVRIAGRGCLWILYLYAVSPEWEDAVIALCGTYKWGVNGHLVIHEYGAAHNDDLAEWLNNSALGVDPELLKQIDESIQAQQYENGMQAQNIPDHGITPSPPVLDNMPAYDFNQRYQFRDYESHTAPSQEHGQPADMPRFEQQLGPSVPSVPAPAPTHPRPISTGFMSAGTSSISTQNASQYSAAEAHPVTHAVNRQRVTNPYQVISINDTEDQLGSPVDMSFASSKRQRSAGNSDLEDEDGEVDDIQEVKRPRQDERAESAVVDDISDDEPAIAAARSRWSTREHTRIINACWGKGSEIYNLILSSSYKVAAKKILSMKILPGRQEAAIKDKIIKIQALYPALKAYFAVTGGGGDADDDPAVIESKLRKMEEDPTSSEYTVNLNPSLLRSWIKNRAWFDVIDERMRGKPNVDKSKDYRSGNLSPPPPRKRKSDHLTAEDKGSGTAQDSPDTMPDTAPAPSVSTAHRSGVPEKPFGGKTAKKELSTTTDALIAVSNFMTAKVESQRRSDLQRDKRLRLEQAEKEFIAAKDLLGNGVISDERKQRVEDIVMKYVTGERAREIEEEFANSLT